MASFNLDPMIFLNMWYSNYNDVIDMNEKIANDLGLIAFCDCLKQLIKAFNEKFGLLERPGKLCK